jgi:origin recognition complex subunit 2
MPPRKRAAPRRANSEDEDAGGASTSGRESGSDDGGAEFGAAPARGRGARAGAPRRLPRGVAAGLVSTYFLPQGGGGGTGGRRAAELAAEAADPAALRDLLAALPERNAAAKAAQAARLRARFGEWWLQLRAGFSILLYGFGSKRDLLSRFAREWAADGACLAVDGLTPGLTAKGVLAWAAALARRVPPAGLRGKDPEELLRMVDAEGAAGRRLYLIVHNLDGPGLRDAAGQRLLARLAALPAVHLAASVDHVNAPLLWDLQTRDRFAWAWHHAPTFAPYAREVATAAVPSLLAPRGAGGGATRASAAVVLLSLSATARDVFRVMAEAQLGDGGDVGGGGSAGPGAAAAAAAAGALSFQRLFAACRERFLVSNEAALKGFLSEFTDHGIMRARRPAGGGADVLVVPLPVGELRALLEEDLVDGT